MANAMRNKTFAETNQKFNMACKALSKTIEFKDFKPTTRQASKFRNKRGIAYKFATGLITPY
jgi:hypothetical protein